MRASRFMWPKASSARGVIGTSGLRAIGVLFVGIVRRAPADRLRRPTNRFQRFLVDAQAINTARSEGAIPKLVTQQLVTPHHAIAAADHLTVTVDRRPAA